MVLAPVAIAQALPDGPKPAPTPASAQSPAGPDSNPQPRPPRLSNLDSFWLHVQQIANGEQVEVSSTYGPPLKCRFAGATDAYLFCDPPGTPAGTGYRFDRAAVLDVRVVRPRRNWHPGLLSAMVGGGLIVGIAATANTDAGHAAEAGFVGALVTGAIAAPFAFLPPPPPPGPYPFGAGVSFRPHALPHGLRMFSLPHR